MNSCSVEEKHGISDRKEGNYKAELFENTDHYFTTNFDSEKIKN